MTLGELLAAARRSAQTFGSWLQSCDPELAGKVDAAAARAGLSQVSYVRAAIADFSRFAGEEDWATLMSSLRDSADPGTMCLTAMVDWRLRAHGCAAHSHVAGPAHRQGAINDRLDPAH